VTSVNLKRTWKVVKEDILALKPGLLDAQKDLNSGSLWKE